MAARKRSKRKCGLQVAIFLRGFPCVSSAIVGQSSGPVDNINSPCGEPATPPCRQMIDRPSGLNLPVTCRAKAMMADRGAMFESRELDGLFRAEQFRMIYGDAVTFRGSSEGTFHS
uniref:Uncharacterized protein n=1 Tax=Branchiostoma floridae TaxID=7739 RepID=C3YP83_BRAFL|eukprot:XP_002601962.1 hypothetical protein BRAFLDRAFT_86447 [Branchiostoma floridae]